jgi:patatin-related protein
MVEAVGGAPENLYAQEVRFGVVMYGGVSLAIYINGVTNELYEMALATPKAGDNANTGRTRDVYRKASYLLRDQELRKRYLAHVDFPPLPDPFGENAQLPPDLRTRFVVDTIAGTSAGGINGLFLAKALVNGQEFAPLKQLWIAEGDIDSLLNDKASYHGLEFAQTNSPPQSLLNSDRMYIKLLDALKDMNSAGLAPVANNKSPLVDEIDLYVTTTDIRGTVTPLRLFDKVVYEKRYKQVYHFQYAPAGDRPRNDLSDDNSPFLAFAARCTSSFPFAFEPMSVADAERLCEASPLQTTVDFDVWKPLFTGLSAADLSNGNWRNRAFGDGGYLDNKPFSYVVDTLSWRLGGLPMERKLIYVEPAPSHPETERQVFDTKPDAIENALAAIFSIPTDQTIREDLGAVLTRNRRIERVEQMVRQVDADLDARDAEPFARIVLDEDGKVPIWRSRGMNDMITYYGAAFLPYWRLRIVTVTDDIAERLADWWGVDRDSDRLYALRAMVRVWREDMYFENQDPNPDPRTRKETVNAFLDDYDVKYRLRRVGLLLRKAHQLLGLAAKFRLPDEQPLLTDIEKRLLKRCGHRNLSPEMLSSDAVVNALRCLARGFGGAMNELGDITWLSAPSQNETERKAATGTFDRVLGLLLGEKSATELEVLATPDGTPVRLPPDMPPPSPLRTLQENVFMRAEFLFEQAKTASKTQIQQLLETDVKLLRAAYAAVIRPTAGLTRVRALLGDPKLDVKTDANGARKVDIKLKDVELPGYDVLNTPEGQTVRALLAEYHLRFDEYDQMSFPLYYDTGTGEPATVEILRVSPEDAPSLINERVEYPRQKLAGTALFHFGAFLDEKWRRNDIMWGRLDGCERLLAALFPADGDRDVREALLQEAQCIIVREEMQPAAYDELIESFAKVLAAQKQSTLNQAFEGLLTHLGAPGSPARQTQTGRILKGLLGDAGTVKYLQQYYEVNRDPDTKKTLKTSARALTITGRILEEAEKHYRSPFSRMVWVTRSGRGLQALLAISMPGSLLQAVSRHWLVLLYVFEALIVAGSALFSSQSALNFGLSAFGLTVGLHLATLLTGDLIGSNGGLIKILAALVSIIVLGLAAVGMFALLNQGPTGVMCAGGPQKNFLPLQALCPQKKEPGETK